MRQASALQREMGCTRSEFMGWLPGATRQAPIRIEGDEVTVATHGGQVRISLEEMPPRRIGLITLPVLGITFRFHGLDERASREFLAFFDLYTRRGGG